MGKKKVIPEIGPVDAILYQFVNITHFYTLKYTINKAVKREIEFFFPYCQNKLSKFDLLWGL